MKWGKWDGKIVVLSERMPIMRQCGGHVHRQHCREGVSRGVKRAFTSLESRNRKQRR